MSSTTTYECDGCGVPVPHAGQAHEFSGILQNQASVADGGTQTWHTCSAKCAARYLRDLADKIEMRGEELARQSERAARGG